MRLSIITPAIVVCLSSAAWVAYGAVVQTHYGDTVPTDEGWTRHMPSSVLNGIPNEIDLDEPVHSDVGYGGLPAWKIANTTDYGTGNYNVVPSLAVLAEAKSLGWKLTAKLRVAQPGLSNPNDPSMLVELGGSGAPNDYDGRFSMVFGSDASGNALVAGWKQTGIFNVAGDGYHQYDLIDPNGSGQVTLYADGVQLATGIPKTDSSLSKRIYFGDGSTAGKSNANYNYVAFETGSDLKPTPSPGYATIPGPGILYTFEQDLGTLITDKLTYDGGQDPIVRGSPPPLVDADPAKAAFGEQSVLFPTNPTVRTTLTLPGSSSLGNAFTLAAMVKETDDQVVSDYSRLFTTYNGGSAGSTELIFDIDPTGENRYVPGVRFVHNGVTVTPPDEPITFNDGEYHHLAATYDNGDVVVYLDGAVVASGDVGGGAVNLFADLQFGEEGSPNEPFEGYADDILVVRHALSQPEIEFLATYGAESAGFLLVPEPASFLPLLLGLLVLVPRRRR